MKLLFILLSIVALFSSTGYAQLPGYSFRKLITIDNTKVAGSSDLIDFPVLISFTDADLATTGNGGRVTDANGYDIVFTSSDRTTLLDFDLEKHVATTGEFVAWVRIPTLDYDDDTYIYIYYGNSSVSTDQSSTNTWNANYQGVWHLDDDPNGDVASSVKDATSNAFHGTPDGNMTSADLVTGKMGESLDFDGNLTINEADVIITADIDKSSDVITYSAWFNTSAANQLGADNDGLIISKQRTNGSTPYALVLAGNNKVKASIHASEPNSPTTLNDGVWHYAVARSDGTNLTLFIDGDSVSYTTPVAWTDNNQSMAIGGSEDRPYYRPFKGKIDEVRISHAAHSADWIATEFNNQNDPSAFFTIGAEIAFAPGGVTDNIVLWLKGNGGVEEAVGDGAEDGDAVNNWVDQSGIRTKDAVKTAAPTFRNNASSNVNYNPVVEFDGIDDGMDFNNDYIYSTGTGSEDGMTFFVVAKPDLSTGKDEQYIFDFGAHNDWGYAGQFNDDKIRLYSPGIAGGPGTYTYYLKSPTNNTTPTLVRYTWDFDDTHQTIHLNGETTASKDDANTTTKLTATEINESATHLGSSGPFTIGRQSKDGLISNNNGRYYQGDIAELVGYKKDVTSSEYTKIESYLAIKYAITLDNTGGGIAGDYIDSNGTIIWDASAAGDHHNEVIAIGRDDKSSLFQKQSHHVDDSLRIFIDALATNNASNTGVITNDMSFIVIGHNGAKQRAQDLSRPFSVIKSRFGREWRVTNTNFDETFSLEIEWNNVDAGGFDITQIRLMVDDDTDFSDAMIFGPSDGLTFSEGSIIVGDISTAHIPKNSTRFITIGSINRGVPLPIELIAFNANVTDQQTVELSWQTASEINNDFFTIEKSKDAKEWNEVKIIDGAGNASEKISYTAVDARPYSGISYYRLKQTDFDGQFTYSDIKVVTLSLMEGNQLNIYPNPGNDQMTIEGNMVELAEFVFYNIYGQNVKKFLKITDQNNAAITIDISRLSNGIYTLKTKNHIRKIIKQ